jgi:hypothetical protein
MSLNTHVQDALERVTQERSYVEEKLTAFREFETAVENRSPEGPGQVAGGNHATDGGMVVSPGLTGQDRGPSRCEQVYTAFAETIVPACRAEYGETDAALSVLREELGDEITLVLAPKTDGRYTPQVKRALIAAISSREAELRTLTTGLDHEIESVRAAGGTVDRVIDWLTAANRTPLSDQGFERLQQRHQTLSDHRERCQSALRERHRTLEATTSDDGSVGVSHRNVVESLYDGFSIETPVCTTLARLDRCCANCQRVVRDHLVRRA